MGYEDLLKRIRALPQGQLRIRLKRAYSWLERSAEVADPEGRFISLWITFNALYGVQIAEGLSAKEFESLREFLEKLVAVDAGGTLASALFGGFQPIRGLVNNRFIFRAFWNDDPDWEGKFDRANKRLLADLGHRKTLPVLEEVFRRLYVLRQQVFHGAMTYNGRYGRSQLRDGAAVLHTVVPPMIQIMADSGPEKDWGDICFRPVGSPDEPVPSVKTPARLDGNRDRGRTP